MRGSDLEVHPAANDPISVIGYTHDAGISSCVDPVGGKLMSALSDGGCAPVSSTIFQNVTWEYWPGTACDMNMSGYVPPSSAGPPLFVLNDLYLVPPVPADVVCTPDASYTLDGGLVKWLLSLRPSRPSPSRQTASALGSGGYLISCRKWSGLPVQVYFDGGKNPRQGTYGSSLVMMPDTEQEFMDRYVFSDNGEGTSNEAEYQSLIGGLKRAVQLAGELYEAPHELDLLVCGDSQLVLCQLNGTYEVHAANLRPFYERARQLLGNFKSVKFQYRCREYIFSRFGH